MAYQVIALKHRPRNFSEVVAQDHITQPLRNAAATGKIHHGYLFNGPRGTGKTTTARILSKAFNCESPANGEPCNKCVSCKEIATASSPNVIEIDAASNRGIDDIRQLREAIRYSPIGAKHKIYIIDEVHQLTSEAFNALLKTLEEPPPHGIFILATTEVQKVPATIVSRCLKFDFRLIPLSRLIETVESICHQEGVEAERDAIEAICVKADGSLRDAFSLLDQVISTGVKKIEAATAAEILGLVNRKLLLEISDAVASSNPLKAVELFNEFIKSGGNIEYFIDSLNRHIRDLLVIKLNPDKKAVSGIGEELLGSYREIAAKMDNGQLLRMLNISAELFSGLRRKTVDPVISAELTLIKISNLEKTVDLEKLLRTHGAANKQVLQGVDLFDANLDQPADNKGPEPVEVIPRTDGADNVPGAKMAELDIEIVKEKWADFIAALNKKKKTLWAQLNGSNPQSLERNVLTILVTHNGIANVVNLPTNQKVIELLTKKIFGKVIKLEFKVPMHNGDVPNSRNFKAQESPAGPTGDEIVDRILNNMGGRLVNWEPKEDKS